MDIKEQLFYAIGNTFAYPGAGSRVLNKNRIEENGIFGYNIERCRAPLCLWLIRKSIGGLP